MFRLSKSFDIGPAVNAADDQTDRDEHHVQQVVIVAAIYTRIGKIFNGLTDGDAVQYLYHQDDVRLPCATNALPKPSPSSAPPTTACS